MQLVIEQEKKAGSLIVCHQVSSAFIPLQMCTAQGPSLQVQKKTSLDLVYQCPPDLFPYNGEQWKHGNDNGLYDRYTLYSHKL